MLVNCFLLDWKLSLMVFGAVPVTLLPVIRIAKRLRRNTGASVASLGHISEIALEALSGIRVVQAFGMEGFENKKFASEGQKLLETVMRVTRIRNLASPSTEFLSAAAGGVIVWYGGMQVLSQGAMKGSEFLGFLFAIFQLMPPIKELSNINNRFQEATAAGKRVFEILDTEPNIKNAPDAVSVGEFRDAIEFHNVGFRYGDGERVLEQINLTIRKGEVVAIVGEEEERLRT